MNWFDLFFTYCFLYIIFQSHCLFILLPWNKFFHNFSPDFYLRSHWSLPLIIVYFNFFLIAMLLPGVLSLHVYLGMDLYSYPRWFYILNSLEGIWWSLGQIAFSPGGFFSLYKSYAISPNLLIWFLFYLFPS